MIKKVVLLGRCPVCEREDVKLARLEGPGTWKDTMLLGEHADKEGAPCEGAGEEPQEVTDS